MWTMVPWTEVAVMFSVGAALVVLGLALYRSGDGSRLPRVRMRDLPKLVQNEPVPESITLAGREYRLERTAAPRGVCTWCQRPPQPGDEIVLCTNPHCLSISHRQHAEENGGCGGICSILR